MLVTGYANGQSRYSGFTSLDFRAPSASSGDSHNASVAHETGESLKQVYDGWLSFGGEQPYSSATLTFELSSVAGSNGGHSGRGPAWLSVGR